MGQLTFQATLGGAVNLVGPNTAVTTNFTLPAADGTNGQALTTNGTGTLAFATVGASAATPTALGTVFGTTANQNAALGSGALNSSTTAATNVAIGYQALYTGTTLGSAGGGSVAVGWKAGYSMGNVGYFTALGNQAGYSCTTEGVFIGYQAGYSNTTGDSNTALGGYNTLYSNTTGSKNTALGREALASNTTSSENVAVGYQALYSYTSTDGTNTAVGHKANTALVSGYQNTALGYLSLYQQSSGYNNTGAGWQSLPNLTTGLNNTAFGAYAGRTITSGQACVYIGHNILASGATSDSELVIGSSTVTGKGNSTGFINFNSGGIYQGNNSTLWSVTSDRRLKKNIADNNTGLGIINQIQVRNFEYRLPEEVDAELKPTDAIQKLGVQLGVIAQELQAVLPECVKTESTGVMSVDADNLTWYMINAIKELKAEFDSYKLTHP